MWSRERWAPPYLANRWTLDILGFYWFGFSPGVPIETFPEMVTPSRGQLRPGCQKCDYNPERVIWLRKASVCSKEVCSAADVVIINISGMPPMDSLMYSRKICGKLLLKLEDRDPLYSHCGYQWVCTQMYRTREISVVVLASFVSYCPLFTTQPWALIYPLASEVFLSQSQKILHPEEQSHYSDSFLRICISVSK